MPVSQLKDIVFDCADQRAVARFWAAALGYTMDEEPGEDAPDEPALIEPPAGGMRIWFNCVPEPKTCKNRVHIDITMPDGAELDRLVGLGARALQEIRGDDGALWWTIMADPEGNEFCAFPPR